MKTVAVILAAGLEKGEELSVPRPFINICDKPVLIYTLEVFERHSGIDAIELVCLEGWKDVASAYAKQHNITKLKWITVGGQSIQETIWNGLKNLDAELADDDIVIIHDGIRPLLDESVINDVINTAKEKGNAVSSLPNTEQIFVINENDTSKTDSFIPRETIRSVSSPQAYHYGEVKEAYQFAFDNNVGIESYTYTDTLFVDLGKTLYFSAGSSMNIKLNTDEERSIFEAYLNRDKDVWLK